jgi:hypothetical protein
MTDYKARWLRVEELNKLLVEESTRRLGLLREWRDMMLVQKEKGSWDSYNESILTRVEAELADE